jgi:nucleolar complex protein 2
LCGESCFSDNEGLAHVHELSKLADQDPGFYKYLQENDAELLEFDPNAMDVPSDGEDAQNMEEDEGKAPVLTSDIIKGWQKALLEVRLPLLSRTTSLTCIQHRSLRALRRLLVAFRSAAHMNEEAQVVAWSIESSAGLFFCPFFV